MIFFCAKESAFETKVAEEYFWARTGGGAVMLWPIKFQCVGSADSS
jgi:hypothetical protein